MKKMNSGKLFATLRKGNSLTDAEILYLMERFKQLQDAVSGFGDVFSLVRSCASQRYCQLHEYANARGLLEEEIA